jgi:hypothetical protein
MALPSRSGLTISSAFADTSAIGSIEQRIRPPHPCGLAYLRQSLLLPQLSKLFDCRRSVARVVVVGVGEDNYAAFPDLIAEIDPPAEFRSPINHCLVPGGRLLLDLFAIT